MPVPVAEISQSQAAIVVSQEQPPAAPAAPPPPAAAVQPAAPLSAAAANNAAGADVEAGVKAAAKCKRKTTQNDQSHGSFFLRIGAIGKLENGMQRGGTRLRYRMPQVVNIAHT